ncbi:MAG TPA: helicase, partial [Gammaproteobacteria bacterium]|nr:helicase [Gammaproteobacteria bacterium]
MVSTFNDAVAAVFDEQGVLANQLTGYRTRQQQIELAIAVANAVDEQHVLLAEAGTGIGKTYAYLVPAILSGKKCIISTGTKNLQDQLFHRDIPQLKQYLDIAFKSTLLKGRHNYLCHHRFYRAQQDPLLQSYHTEFEALQHWIMVSKTGDLGDTDILLQQPQLWPQVTSNTDNCLGNNCQYLAECFINEARKKAQEADIVVVNHHVLLADITLKIAEQGELLPAADSYIIDEAHQFPTIAIPFFSDSISSQQ